MDEYATRENYATSLCDQLEGEGAFVPDNVKSTVKFMGSLLGRKDWNDFVQAYLDKACGRGYPGFCEAGKSCLPVISSHDDNMKIEKDRMVRFLLIAAAMIVISNNADGRPYAGVETSPSEPALFSYTDLKKIIKDNSVRSIDELLPLLPEEYRKHYTLLYKSRSLQFASSDSPRVILYGPDAKLVISFSGNSKTPDFASLEVIEWNPKERTFDFHEISFSGYAKVSEKPQSCLACHGEGNPRPNWDGYNAWRGAFGSLSRAGVDTIKKGSLEDQYFQQFQQNRNQGRYRWLPPPIKVDPDRVYRISGDRDLYATPNGASSGPNNKLTDLLGNLNYERIAHEIVNSRLYPIFKYVLAAKYSCPQPLSEKSISDSRMIIPVDQYFPENWQHAGAKFNEVLSKVQASLQEQFNRRVKAVLKYNQRQYEPDDGEKGQKTSIAEWVYVAERMGIDIESWSMAFDEGTYAFQTGYYTSREIIERVAMYMEKDSDLKNLLPPKEPWYERKVSKGLCEKLRKKSVAKLSEQLPPGIKLAAKRPKILRACIGCHVAPNAVGAEIPFHSESALKTLLEQSRPDYINTIHDTLTTSEQSKRMPKGMPALSASEVEELEGYLRSVAKQK